MSRPLLVFIVGPTASGKSDFAVEALEKAGRRAEIINCDSVQFFDGVDIGAAKPSADLLARIPHHLIGHVALGASYTAGDFRRDALKVIEASEARIFAAVGGSGFYVQALEKGMYDVPEVDPENMRRVREELAAEAERPAGVLLLHRELSERDPEAAAKIQPADRYRILRALEILRTHPGTLTAIRARFEKERPPAPFDVVKFGLTCSRERLRERVEARTRQMLASGLIEEVEGLRARGLTDWAPLRSVGYKETQAFLDGALSKEDLFPAIVTSTMQLAKRQMTWFKRDRDIRWFDRDLAWAEGLEIVASGLSTRS